MRSHPVDRQSPTFKHYTLKQQNLSTFFPVFKEKKLRDAGSAHILRLLFPKPQNMGCFSHRL